MHPLFLVALILISVSFPNTLRGQDGQKQKSIDQPSSERAVHYWDHYSTTEFAAVLPELNALTSLPGATSSPEELTTIQNALIDANGQLTTYSSFGALTQYQDGEGKRIVNWAVIRESTDKHSVYQLSGELQDTWIVDSQDLYLQLGVWFRSPLADTWQEDTTRFLRLENVVRLLSQGSVTRGVVATLGDQRYSAIVAFELNLDTYGLMSIKDDWECHGVFVYDAETTQLMAFYAGIVTGPTTSWGYTQVFFDQSIPVEIVIPEAEFQLPTPESSTPDSQ